jgi:hypothetical protein
MQQVITVHQVVKRLERWMQYNHCPHPTSKVVVVLQRGRVHTEVIGLLYREPLVTYTEPALEMNTVFMACKVKSTHLSVHG